MSDFADIQNMLQTGYFTTSRARHTYSSVNPVLLPPHCYLRPACNSNNDSRYRYSADSHSRPLPSSISSMYRHVPRSFDERPRRRRSYPPPPSVEDEAVSLEREHGSSVTPVFEEEPQSRGDIDQQPIMLEVHEYNPERRFVHVSSSSTASNNSATEDKAAGNKTRQKPRPAEQPPFETRDERNTSESTKHFNSDDPFPSLGRSRSRQDLPRLETELGGNRAPTHHRSKSAASASRPDFSSPRQSRPYGDGYLSPEVFKHGSSGRDKSYHGYGYERVPTEGTRSPTENSFSRTNDQRWDGKYYHRRSATPSAEVRPSSAFEPGSSRRPIPNDRVGDLRRGEGSRSPRSDTRDKFEPYRPSSRGETLNSPLAYRPREHGSPESFRSSRRRGDSIVIEDDRDSLLSFDGGTRISRSPSRTRTMPVSSIDPMERVDIPRNAPTFPIENEARSQERRKPYLPYPDDDETDHAWYGEPGASDVAGQSRPGSASITSMPHIPPMVDGPMMQNDTGSRVPSPSAAPSTQSWPPPSFDPDRDGVRIDNPVGSYRRYSENKGHDGQEELPEIPECIRTEPVVGKMDWLTLPRTDFNICPDCYGGVFANTKYRTHFQPMLRPTVNPIACDFGSSPWFRIAWLLTLKYRVPDLRLFHHIADIMSASRNQPCPSNRKAVRNWYTVEDPCTEKPVPEFTVCYQCSKTIEALLPNLTGIFTPLDHRQGPTRSVCALHFTPERRQFVLFFDAFETTSDHAYAVKGRPDLDDLSMTLTRLSTLNECRQDRPVSDGYWYTMDFLPELTVCGECYEDVVHPQRGESALARNFISKARKIPIATCQLYSPRMRDVFRRACRRNNPDFLEEMVRERLQIEEDVHAKRARLLRDGRNDTWTDEQMEKLRRDWKRWE